MKVNFNNLRRQAVYSYNRLCGKLNDAIIKSEDRTWIDDFGWVEKGCLVINSEDIQEDMDNLRTLVGSIAMTYVEGNEDFADVYPKTPMAIFNEDCDEMEAASKGE